MHESALIVGALKEGFWWKALIGTILATIPTALGQDAQVINALYILVLADLVTGILKTYSEHKWKKIKGNAIKRYLLNLLRLLSSIKSKGLMLTIKKLVIYGVLLLTAHQMSIVVPVLFWFRQMTAGYIAVNEGLSIIENAAALGYKLPKKVVTTLHTFLRTGEFK